MKPDLQTHSDEHPDDEPGTSGEHFTAEEVAAFIGISVEEFFDRAAHADLTPVEIEEKYFYRARDVRRFLVNTGVLDGESLW
ncbi:MAG: hypothetical protein JWN98_1410 [Abditibacteriota bacterium]|jgi:hypothetical protein|nr:hypothetical protein [Abditibacteriota bacterium]